MYIDIFLKLIHKHIVMNQNSIANIHDSFY